MARTMIEGTQIQKWNEAAELGEYLAVSATDGCELKMEADQKLLILIKNEHATDAKTVTVKAGNGFAAGGDLAVSVKAGKTYAMVLESGKFGVVSGAESGKILMEAAADVKVNAVVLP